MNPPDPQVPLLLAHGVPGPPVPAVLPQEIRTYAQLYASQAPTFYPDGYGALMAHFDPTNPVTAAALLDRVAGNSNIPQGYLQVCTPTEGKPRVFCLHRPSRFFPDITGVPSEWDNQCFASIGDVTDNVITMTYLPANAFELTDEVNVYSAFDCAQFLTTDTDAHLLPPPLVDGTLLKCRRMMALPAHYLPLFMDSAGIPLREAWLLLYPLLIQDNLLATCTHLIDWFRVALVQHPFTSTVDSSPILNTD